SYLDLAPRNKISGGKVVGREKDKRKNRAGLALRLAAGTLLESDTYLGAQYRRLRTKLGAPKARKAMANKLARIAYRILKYGEKYVDKGKEFYEQKYRQLQIRMLTKKATELGFVTRTIHASLAVGFWRVCAGLQPRFAARVTSGTAGLKPRAD